MENSLSTSDPGHDLATTATPPTRIGKVDYRGLSVTARALLVTYDQKMTVSGSIAPTIGATHRGTGGVFSAGGQIGSHNESVATVVYVNRDGVENTVELPSDTSVREGSVFRMDYLNGQRFAVRNISGNQPVRWLRGAGSFIHIPDLRGWHIILIGIALLVTFLGHWFWGILYAALPAWRIWRQTVRRAEIRRLSEYMTSITR